MPPPPLPQQKITMLKSDFCPCECKWTTLIYLLSEGRGHGSIGVLWERKYKTYFVQDSFATYASLKIITKGIFSWKAWLNETINTFSSHMKLDKINCILIDDGLLNLKDLQILTSRQRLQVTTNVLSDELALLPCYILSPWFSLAIKALAFLLNSIQFNSLFTLYKIFT